jgi:hypothetical protein
MTWDLIGLPVNGSMGDIVESKNCTPCSALRCTKYTVLRMTNKMKLTFEMVRLLCNSLSVEQTWRDIQQSISVIEYIHL